MMCNIFRTQRGDMRETRFLSFFLSSMLFLMGLWLVPFAFTQVQHSSAAVDQLTKQGWELYRSGNLDGASVAFRNAIALNPKDGILYFNLGMVLFDKGSLPEAAQAYEKSIPLLEKQNVPRLNLSNALNNLAVIY